MEGARGFPGFKKDPKAYLLYHLKQARDNKLTPPDWWHAARREEERRQSEFNRRSNEPLGDDQAESLWSRVPKHPDTKVVDIPRPYDDQPNY